MTSRVVLGLGLTVLLVACAAEHGGSSVPITSDAATPDAARPVPVDAAGAPDAALPDAAVPDAAVPDAALPDAALPDDPAGCELPPGAAPLPPDGEDLHHVSLGVVRFGDDGVSAPLAFTLPEDVESFQLSVRSNQGARLVIHRVTGPSGELFVRDVLEDDVLMGLVEAAPQFFSPHRMTPGTYGATGLFTRLPVRAPVRGGMYTLLVAGRASGARPCPAAVDLYYRTAIVEKGLLELALYYPEGLVSGPDPVADDPRLRAVVRGVEEIFAQAAIDVRVAHAAPLTGLPSVLQPEHEEGGERDFLYRILRRVEDPARGLPVVLVDRMTGLLRGRAAGIPVDPFGRPGAQSGIIASLREGDEPFDAERTARIVAHELGHALGLFHTSELAWSDAIPDTPADGDGAYLMSTRAGGTLISPMQAQVMRQAARVRARATSRRARQPTPALGAERAADPLEVWPLPASRREPGTSVD